MPQTFYHPQLFQEMIFFEDSDALFLIPKNQQIVARMNVKDFPSGCGDNDLSFLSHFYHAENVFAFGRHFQP